jgi:hypothetical protein
MNTGLSRNKRIGPYWWEVGIELRDWALPVNIDLQNGVLVTVLCFYVGASRFLPLGLGMAQTVRSEAGK